MDDVFDNAESLEHSYTQSGYIIRLMSQPQQAVDPEADISENNQAISDDEANNSLDNSIIIEDISYQENIQNNPDVEELRSLLISWKQEHLLDYFLDQQVFVNTLQVIKRHHIERLLKKFDMGTQILFEHNLEEWRKLMGTPLDENRTLTATTLEQLHNIESARSTPDSDCASAGSSLRYSPYSSKSPSDPGSNIMLSQILNESSKASMLSEYFKKFSKFEEEQRNALIGIIARYFEDSGIPMTMKTSYRLEQEILERFPTEKLEYYRTSKRGKLYNKWRNSNVSFKHAVSDYLSPKSQKQKGVNKEARMKLEFVPEEDAEATIRSLKFDNLSSEEFDHCWKACSKYRLDDINKLDSTSAILEKWPFYKQPSGFRLIDMDFTTKHENGDGLLKNWEQEVPKILLFLNGNVKDKTIKFLLNRIKNEDIEENGRNAAILWAFHGYFVPTNKVVKKDVTGKKQTIKFTIRDSQQSFFFLGKNVQEVEEWIQFLNKNKTAVQPFTFAIGEDIAKIDEIYTYFEGIKYKFFSVTRAVDICFKIMYVLNLNFPTESIMFWSFIGTHFYKFHSENSFPKIHILCEYLNNDQ